MEHLWTPWRMEYLVSEKAPGCPFCAALAADDDCGHYILYRGETCFVILNKYPYNNGHLMILPYRHVSDFPHLSTDERREFMELVDLSLRAHRRSSNPDGFNVGMNLGEAAGAGITEHIHMHIVPRWSGDTNFMTAINDTRAIPELLEQAWERLKPVFDELTSDSACVAETGRIE